MIIAKYKANSTDCLPTFNGGYIYTSSYVDNGDGTYTFTLESDNNFTSVNFQQKQSLLSVEKLAVTSSCTALNSLFNSCSNLTSVNTQGWDTSNVTTFWALCYQCPNLLEIDVSKFDTSNADNMYAMFYGCNKLTSLDLSNFNTSKVTTMGSMFKNCYALTSLDLSNWNTSKVTNMNTMFYYSSNLKSLDISNFTITDSTNVSNIFDALNLSEIGMLYCNKATIDKVTSKLPSSSKSNIYVLDEDISNLNKLDNITFIKALEYEEEITLPYQMAKVDGVKDRLYYDESAGKYILEKNIDEDFNVIEKQVIETDIDLMELDTYDTTYITVTSRLDSELKVNEEYCKLDILSSDGGENSINNELFLSEPLRRIGDISDRLYWDFTKEKYIIERNIGVADFSKVDVNDFEHFSYNAHNGFSNIVMSKASFNKHFLPYKAEGTMNALCTCFNIEGTTYQKYKECFALHADGGQSVQFNLSNERFDDDLSKKSAINILKGMGTVIYYELNTPIYEELDINRMDLKSYIPTTHLTTPNIPLKTSITVDTNIAKYKPLELLPDTKYTLLVDAMGGENDIINVDLGGATNRFKPTQYAYGKNKVSITTPSTLSTDYLSIYGETNKVKDIMLIQGDVNQHPEYFDGTQSTGELQGDGSYKIDILSQSEPLNSRDIQGNIPITLEGTNEGKYITIDEIYGNTWQDTKNSTNLFDINNMSYDWNGQSGVVHTININNGNELYIHSPNANNIKVKIHLPTDRLSLNKTYYIGVDFVEDSNGDTQLYSELVVDGVKSYSIHNTVRYTFNITSENPTVDLMISLRSTDSSWKERYLKVRNIYLSEVDEYEPFYKADLSDIRSVGELQEDGTYKVDIGTYNCDLFELSDIDQIYAFKPLALMTVERFEPVKHLFNEVSGYATANNLYDYYYIDGTKVWIYVGETDKANAVKVLNDHIIKNTKPEIKSSIYLPQPLSMIGEYQDKLYWDDEKGKYCIEQNVKKIILDGSADEDWTKNTQANNDSKLLLSDGLVSTLLDTKNLICSLYPVRTFGEYNSHTRCISKWNNYIIVKNGGLGVDELKKELQTTPMIVYYQLATPNLIETDITEKISLNSYNETTYVTTNSNVEHEIKGLYNEVKSHNVSILLDSPLTNDDKIYYDNGYKVDRNGNIEIPVTKGNEINLPKLYQGINTYINTTTGNIKPSEIKVEYKEFK